jgi:hypothetical protein
MGAAETNNYTWTYHHNAAHVQVLAARDAKDVFDLARAHRLRRRQVHRVALAHVYEHLPDHAQPLAVVAHVRCDFALDTWDGRGLGSGQVA